MEQKPFYTIIKAQQFYQSPQLFYMKIHQIALARTIVIDSLCPPIFLKHAITVTREIAYKPIVLN